ncbi:hypothetical protein AGMMS50256_25350 [Betaproteobacteria bacterium]|nr:hypothetical protein AGMMS50256_25350 [Betaproteobacteria bacterium]
MEVKFSTDAWEQYLYWQEQDRRTLKRINQLLQQASYRKHIPAARS